VVGYIFETKMGFELGVVGLGWFRCKKPSQRNPASRVARPHLGRPHFRSGFSTHICDQPDPLLKNITSEFTKLEDAKQLALV